MMPDTLTVWLKPVAVHTNPLRVHESPICPNLGGILQPSADYIRVTLELDGDGYRLPDGASQEAIDAWSLALATFEEKP